MDSALYGGYSIPPYYDSLIGKLIVHGRDRPEALARLHRALGELIIDGVETTVPLFHALLAEPDIQIGQLQHPLAGKMAGRDNSADAPRGQARPTDPCPAIPCAPRLAMDRS